MSDSDTEDPDRAGYGSESRLGWSLGSADINANIHASC